MIASKSENGTDGAGSAERAPRETSAGAAEIAPGQPPGEAARARPPGLVDRTKVLVKKHPGASLLVAAGAGTLIAGEFAIGAAVGVGATLLLIRGDREKRRRILERGRGVFDAGTRWARDLMRRGRDLAPAKAQAPATPAAEATSPEPKSSP